MSAILLVLVPLWVFIPEADNAHVHCAALIFLFYGRGYSNCRTPTCMWSWACMTGNGSDFPSGGVCFPCQGASKYAGRAPVSTGIGRSAAKLCTSGKNNSRPSNWQMPVCDACVLGAPSTQGPSWSGFSPSWPWWAPGGTSHQVGWSGEARGSRGGAPGGAALAFDL
jgi:hypothetical protein